MTSRVFKLTSAASTNVTPVGYESRLTGYNIVNTNAAARYVKLFWAPSQGFSSSGDVPTLGTDLPLVTILIPATSTVAAQFGASPVFQKGRLVVATTVSASDTASDAVGSGDLLISLFVEGGQ